MCISDGGRDPGLPIHRRVIPPVYLTVTLLAMWSLDRWLPLLRLLQRPLTFIGVLPIIAGIALAASGAGAFSRAGTPVVPFTRSTALVTDGLYRYSRNPMYLGMLLTVAGAWIALGSLSPGFMGALLFLVLRQWFVLPEELLLAGTFGEAYGDYCKKVRRWL